MSSDHLEISSVRKSLVASCVCVCVGEVLTHVFNMFVSSTEVFVTIAQIMFIPLPKVFISSTINTFVLMEGGIENQAREKSL